MTRLEQWILQHLHGLRRTTQVATLLFLALIPFLNRQGWNHIIGTLYSIKIGALQITDPALVLQLLLLTKSITLPLIIAALIPLLLAFLMGRVFCSWLCPFNLLAELVAKIPRFHNSVKQRLSNQNPRRYIYWSILVIIFLTTMVSGIPIITLTSMPGLLSAQLGDLIFAGEIGLEISLVLLVLILEYAFASRFWCKYVCPVGGVLALATGKPTLRVQFIPQKCNCKSRPFPCHISCPIGLDPRHPELYPYCYNCGDCVDVCQSYGKALVLTHHSREFEKISPVKSQIHNLQKINRGGEI